MVAEPVRSLAFGSITNTFMGVGTALAFPANAILLQNLTNASMFFSFDGINKHIFLPNNGILFLDIANNKAQATCFISQGERIYVEYASAPSSGAVYVTSFYGTTGSGS